MRQLLVNQQWGVKGGDAERKSQKRRLCWDIADGSHATTVEMRLETQDGCPGKAKLPFTEDLKIHSADLEMQAERGLETAAAC